MAARKPKASAPSLYALAAKQIVALYDAGVLSPVVLHHVIAAYAESGIDWSETSTLKTVDNHTPQEVVVLIMMPGRALRSAQKDFLSVVEHLTGSTVVEEAEDDESFSRNLAGTMAALRPLKKLSLRKNPQALILWSARVPLTNAKPFNAARPVQ
jgi:hypothetical protein